MGVRLLPHQNSGMNFLAIDWGKSKIGLATGSDETHLASPFKTIRYKNREDLFAELKELIASEMIDAIVLGIPVSLEGARQMKSVFHSFEQELSRLALPVIIEDERLSTQQAKNLMREGLSHIEDDQIAAMVILQTYLDRLKRENESNV